MITQRGLDDHEDDIQTWHKKMFLKQSKTLKEWGRNTALYINMFAFINRVDKVFWPQ